jgi:peptidoglycan/xylan/chitin deacetylase (PgdA/CDA1 family)
VRHFFIKILIILGIHGIFRFIYQQRRLTVILYHDIDPDSFENQIKYLIKNYTIIDLGELQRILIDQTLKIPKRAILVTFDDGHAGNYKLLSVFKKYKIRPVIFLTSQLIGTYTPFWFMMPFKDTAEMQMLMLVPDPERRIYLKDHFGEIKESETPQALSLEMIREMIPYVDYGSHTVDHPCLINCSDEDAWFQIQHSKKMITEITNQVVNTIAYPNGDFKEREIKMARQAGYKLGFSAYQGFNNIRTNVYSIKRLSINDTPNFNEFLLRLTGVWMMIVKIKSLKNGLFN